MPVGLVGPILVQVGKAAFRYTVRAINLQGDALRAVLQTSPSRNILGRGAIRGIRHGLAGGAVASPFIEQYKGIADVIQTQRQRPQTNKFQKKYSSKRGYNSRSRNQYRYNSKYCRVYARPRGNKSSRSRF